MPGKKAIWIIEDDEDMQFAYEDILGEDYELAFFSTLQDFVLCPAWKAKPDLLIFDLLLPDGAVHKSFARLQDRLRDTPFLVVSALDTREAIHDSFAWGAVDFISKPFGCAELQFKVERYVNALTRSFSRPTAGCPLFRLNGLTMTATNEVGASPELTAREYRILSLFVESQSTRVSRERFFETLWHDVSVSDKTLDVHLSHIRRKLSPLGLIIRYEAPTYEICRIGPSA